MIARCTAAFLKLVVCGVLGLTSAALAQETSKLLLDRTVDQSPLLLVLGSGHLHNPGKDLNNPAVGDVLTDPRQAEIEIIAKQLAAFGPTHVALEWPQSEQGSLDRLYEDYREGRHQLSAFEGEQFGFRVAAQRHLERLHAVDWNGLPPGDQVHYNWLEYGQAHGHDARIEALQDPSNIPFPPLGESTLSAWLLTLNSPDTIARSQRIYFDIAMIGDGETRPGANWVSHWYNRNLRILTNLMYLTDRTEDRVLVIFGAGHTYLLRQLARESGAFRLANVSDVLKVEE